MSFLETLLNSMAGDVDEPAGDLPCANCPSGCSLAPDHCAACQPYKEKLIDALYHVEHMDEFLARYEVVESLPAGLTECPHCGAPSDNAFACSYCGMQLRESDGKIRVTSASEIPNPILQAQDIIFERYQNIVQPCTASAAVGGGDLLSTLASLLLGEVSEQGQATLGSKMTVDEIKEAASICGVSVSSYLTGLDNGKYATLAGLKRAAAMDSNVQPQSFGIPGFGSTFGPSSFGPSGLSSFGFGSAGLGTIAGLGMAGLGMTGAMGRPGGPGMYPPSSSPYRTGAYGQPTRQGSYYSPQQSYGRPPQPPYGSGRPPVQQPYGRPPVQQQPYGRPGTQQQHTTNRPQQQSTGRPPQPGANRPPQQPSGNRQQQPKAPKDSRTPPGKPSQPTTARMSQWADKADQKKQPTPPSRPTEKGSGKPQSGEKGSFGGSGGKGRR